MACKRVGSLDSPTAKPLNPTENSALHQYHEASHHMHPATRQVLREHNDLSILASFPGEIWDEQAVYVRRQEEPAFVLLVETWWHDAIGAALTRLASRLPALAERSGCPVAGLVSARFWSMDRSSLPNLLEQAR